MGALDMSGNVYEWTSTRYDDIDYSKSTLDFQGLFPYPYRAEDGRETDETLEQYNSKSKGNIYTLRVARGGSWNYSDTFLRGAARSGVSADFGLVNVGFRCARS